MVNRNQWYKWRCLKKEYFLVQEESIKNFYILGPRTLLLFTSFLLYLYVSNDSWKSGHRLFSSMPTAWTFIIPFILMDTDMKEPKNIIDLFSLFIFLLLSWICSGSDLNCDPLRCPCHCFLHVDVLFLPLLTVLQSLKCYVIFLSCTILFFPFDVIIIILLHRETQRHITWTMSSNEIWIHRHGSWGCIKEGTRME